MKYNGRGRFGTASRTGVVRNSGEVQEESRM
jgi:hypothetical protein